MTMRRFLVHLGGPGGRCRRCDLGSAGAPSGGARKNSAGYEWSYLGPRFGWDYYICHTFDSP